LLFITHTVPFSYWRKRKKVPRKPASVDVFTIRQLEQNLSNYSVGNDKDGTKETNGKI
jgi:hypothetical protein